MFSSQLAESVKTSFKSGMRIEVVDPKYISRTRVAVVKSNIGGRLQLVYEDQSDAPENVVLDFWCHMRSPLLHHIGWSSSVGHDIKAPGRPLANLAAYLSLVELKLKNVDTSSGLLLTF